MKKARFYNYQEGPDKSILSTNSDSATKSDMITIDELRSCPGFEKIDNDEGYEIIKSLYQLSLITYEIINK